jgi:PAS domain S-box-containing protein
MIRSDFEQRETCPGDRKSMKRARPTPVDERVDNVLRKLLAKNAEAAGIDSDGSDSTNTGSESGDSDSSDDNGETISPRNDGKCELKIFAGIPFIALDTYAAITHVSQGFSEMSGYAKKELIGRGFRQLQGPLTCPHQIEKIRACVSCEIEAQVELINYKKDGTPFKFRLSLAPARDPCGKVTHYVGVHTPLPLDMEPFRKRVRSSKPCSQPKYPTPIAIGESPGRTLFA